jgi:shikimate kinase
MWYLGSRRIGLGSQTSDVRRTAVARRNDGIGQVDHRSAGGGAAGGSGRTISELFAESEAAFRGEELAAVRSVAGDAIVVAVGGGAVTTEAAEIMAESGVVVWLRAEVATLASRLTDDDSRPLLLDDDGTRLFGLASERAPLYAAVASGAVDTDGKQPEAVAREVVEVWMNASSQV